MPEYGIWSELSVCVYVLQIRKLKSGEEGLFKFR